MMAHLDGQYHHQQQSQYQHHLNHMLSNNGSGLHVQTTLPQQQHGTMRGMSTYLVDESTLGNHMNMPPPPLPVQYSSNPSASLLRYSSLGMNTSLAPSFVSFFFFCFTILPPAFPLLHSFNLNYHNYVSASPN